MFKPALLSAALATAISAHAAPLKLDVFNPGEAAIFPVASVIVSGAKDAVLIDAPFARRSAQAGRADPRQRQAPDHRLHQQRRSGLLLRPGRDPRRLPGRQDRRPPDVIAGIEAQESRQGRLLGAYPERQRTAASNRAAAAERQRHHAGRPEAEHHA
jgi:hypothetical protein